VGKATASRKISSDLAMSKDYKLGGVCDKQNAKARISHADSGSGNLTPKEK
jgi:hypothetical protein